MESAAAALGIENVRKCGPDFRVRMATTPHHVLHRMQEPAQIGRADGLVVLPTHARTDAATGPERGDRRTILSIRS